jgi:hypothetical protein
MKKTPLRRGLFAFTEAVSGVRGSAEDHLARRAHAVVFVTVRVGRGDQGIFIVARDRRAAEGARNLESHGGTSLE